MAESGGRLLQQLAKHAAALKQTWNKAALALEGRLNPLLKPQPTAIPVRVSQPLHPVARIRQNASHGRWYTTRAQAYKRTCEVLRQYTTFAESSLSATPGLRYNRASYPISKTSTIVNSLPGRSPFAHTLRPNLTGGTLSRSAGGYTLGSGRIGGARYFSHGPAAPAQVVQNVSQAVRAFWLSGSKAQYDGIDARTGNKRFRTISATKHQVTHKLAAMPKATPGSWVDFFINPTITALTSLTGVAGYPSFGAEDATSLHAPQAQANLNTSGLLDILHTDFSRSLRDLAAILADLKQLASLGDLPITYELSPTGPCLRIHFPGTDAETVEKLCAEMNVTRGVVTQDAAYDAYVGSDIALMFPFAPSKPASEHAHHGRDYERAPIEWSNMLVSQATQGFQHDETSNLSDFSAFNGAEDESVYNDDHDDDDVSIQSEQDLLGLEHDAEYLGNDNPWLTSLDRGHDSAGGSSSGSRANRKSTGSAISTTEVPLEYQDFEGIRRFIELCDGVGAGAGTGSGRGRRRV